MSRSLYAKLHRRFGPRPSGAERHRRSLRKREEMRAAAPFLEAMGGGRRALVGQAPESVVVIGAGFSGLNAAAALSALGVAQVTVLEAGDRVGGRVLSSRTFVPGRVIEAGAELIGANHPMWLDLARTRGLGLSVITSEDQYSAAGFEVPFYLNDQLLTAKEAEMLYAEMDQVMEWIAADAAAITDAFAPWLSPGAAQLDQASVADKLREWGVDEESLLWQAMRVQQGNDNVAELDEQSYLGLLALVKGGSFKEDYKAYWTESEVYRCENGNDALATSLAAFLMGRGVQIVTGALVSGIGVGDDGVAVRYITGQEPLEQTITVEAEYAVLATPATTWGDIQFNPPLTLGQYQMSAGKAVKYLSRMKNRFWIENQNASAPSGASDELGMTWEGTDNQMIVEGQGVELSLFVGGPFVHDDAFYQPNQIKQSMEVFHPGFSNSFDQGVFVNWPADPLFRTGYSCPSPGQVCTIGRRLNQPFAGRLFFAGEQACMAYFGYMEGALQAGWAAAHRILNAEGGIAAPSPDAVGGAGRVLRLSGNQALVVRMVGDNVFSVDVGTSEPAAGAGPAAAAEPD